MTRFEREQIGTETLPASLGTAADDLKSTIEREVREIVEAAEARAAEIEAAALERAAELERDSRHSAERILNDSRERARQMIKAIELLDKDLAVAVTSLRVEAEVLLSQLEGDQSLVHPAQADGGAQLGADQQPDVSISSDNGSTEQTDQQAEPTPVVAQAAETKVSASPAPEHDSASSPAGADSEGWSAANPDAREMVRAQIMGMFHAGKSRADAERFLMRFKQGESYVDLLDEIYFGQDPPARRRRGLLRRR